MENDFYSPIQDVDTVADPEGVIIPSLEEMYAAMDIYYIEVPKEPSAFSMFSLPERPELFEDQNLVIEKDNIFIVAGLGVVASKEAYEKLNGYCIIEWEE